MLSYERGTPVQLRGAERMGDRGGGVRRDSNPATPISQPQIAPPTLSKVWDLEFLHPDLELLRLIP